MDDKAEKESTEDLMTVTLDTSYDDETTTPTKSAAIIPGPPTTATGMPILSIEERIERAIRKSNLFNTDTTTTEGDITPSTTTTTTTTTTKIHVENKSHSYFVRSILGAQKYNSRMIFKSKSTSTSSSCANVPVQYSAHIYDIEPTTNNNNDGIIMNVNENKKPKQKRIEEQQSQITKKSPFRKVSSTVLNKETQRKQKTKGGDNNKIIPNNIGSSKRMRKPSSLLSLSSSSSSLLSSSSSSKWKIIVKDLGSFASRSQAFHKCEISCQERDTTTSSFISKSSNSNKNNTHFHLEITSSYFIGKTHKERVLSVYQILLEEFASLDTTLVPADFKKIQKISYYGTNVLSLNYVRHVYAQMPFHILMDLRVPSLVSMDTAAIINNEQQSIAKVSKRIRRSINNNNTNKKKKVKQKVIIRRNQTQDKSNLSRQQFNNKTSSSASSTTTLNNIRPIIHELFLDPTNTTNTTTSNNGTSTMSIQENSSSSSSNNRGGIYGHFFHDLKTETKEIFMQEYQRNLRMIHGDSKVLDLYSYQKNVVRTNHNNNKKSSKSVVELMEKVKKKKDEKIDHYHHNKSKSSSSLLTTATSSSKSLYNNYNINNTFYSYNNINNNSNNNAAAVNMMKNETISRYELTQKKLISHIIRIQRIYRINYFIKTKRMWFLSQHLANRIQRIWRGYKRREYASFFRLKMTFLAVSIQKWYRGHKGREFYKVLYQELFHLATLTQPIIRGFLARRLFQWMRQNWGTAIFIQRFIRGYLARSLRKKLLEEKHLQYIHYMVTKIQNTLYRIPKAKQSKQKLQDILYYNQVYIPSLIKIQSRFWRRIMAMNQFHNSIKKKHYAAIQIQRIWRAHHQYKHFQHFFFWEVIRPRCATLIQRNVRFHLIDSRIWKYSRILLLHSHQDIPSSIKIQALYRGYKIRKPLLFRKYTQQKALMIQQIYRIYLARKKRRMVWMDFLIKTREKASIQIQKLFRGYRTKLFYRNHIRPNYLQKKFRATHVIQHYWKQYKTRKEIKQISEQYNEASNEMYAKQLEQDFVSVMQDIEDVKQEIRVKELQMDWVKNRIREIRRFVDLATKRVAEVEYELQELVKEEELDQENELEYKRNHNNHAVSASEDENNESRPTSTTKSNNKKSRKRKKKNESWRKQILQKELTQLHNKISMATIEEQQICPTLSKQYQKNIIQLKYELNDLYQNDLDPICASEMDLLEDLKRKELERTLRKKDEIWEEKIKKELKFWKIRDVDKEDVKKKKEKI